MAIFAADLAYKKYQENIYTDDTGNVYFLQQGVYTNSSSIKNIRASYITVKHDKKYYIYVGMSTNLENALKVQEYYAKKDIPVYIKSETVQNQEFLSELGQYDVLLSSCSDEELPNILETILSTYEEIFITS